MSILHAEFRSPSGVQEHYFAGTAERRRDFRAELAELLGEYEESFKSCGCTLQGEQLLRFHLSDPANQAGELHRQLGTEHPFVSVTGQAPAKRSRVALEAWHWGTGTLRNYTPFWYQFPRTLAGSYEQTAGEFAALQQELASRGMSLEANTVRTWLYCRDVDNNYAGLVKARNDCFAQCGLVPGNHFIASTGIEGVCEDPHRLVRMDSISFAPLQKEQRHYLNALDHLGSTADYGVSFERGTQLIFGDRSHLYISGTASIDPAGKVVYPGDAGKQAQRLTENIAALLADGGATLADLKSATLYLRDTADWEIVMENLLDAGLPADLPLVTLKAPVCRPAWLVEMECFAVTAQGDARFPVFG